MPDYFARREAQINEVADLQKAVALLRLYGPRNVDDLALIYGIKNGKIVLPTGPLYEPTKWYEGQDQSFARGIFNPRRYVGEANIDANKLNRWDWKANPNGNRTGSITGTNDMGASTSEWFGASGVASGPRGGILPGQNPSRG